MKDYVFNNVVSAHYLDVSSKELKLCTYLSR